MGLRLRRAVAAAAASVAAAGFALQFAGWGRRAGKPKEISFLVWNAWPWKFGLGNEVFALNECARQNCHAADRGILSSPK